MAPLSKNMMLKIHVLHCQYICIAAWVVIEELMDRLQQTWVEKPLRESNEVKHDIAFDVQQGDNNEDAFNVASPSSIPQSQGNNTIATSSRTSKRKYDDFALKVANEKFEMLMSNMKESTTALINHDTPGCVEKEYTKAKIFEKLDKLNLPQETLINAYIALGTSKEKTQLFFSAPERLRAQILSRLMNA